MPRFEKLIKRVLLTGTIRTLSPLHIGSGKETLIPGDPTPIMTYFNGKPYIPGSSLKGVTRAECERLWRSKGIGVCSNKDCNLKRLCVSCDLFGSIEVGSRIIFRDSQASKFEIGIRTGIALDPETRTAKRGAKYDLQFVEPESEFLFEVILENPKDNDIEILKTILTNIVALGGNSTRGFGKVEFINIAEKDITPKLSVKE